MKIDLQLGGVLKRAGMGFGMMAVMWLGGCAPPDGGLRDPSLSPSAAAPRAPAAESRAAEERPGLATGFGREIRDGLVRRSFVRAKSSPAGTDLIYYNDKSGIEAMAGRSYKVEPLQTAAGGLVEWGVKGSFGYLPAYKSGGRRFVVGSQGSAYSLWVKNRCRSRLEVVLSVDGLDVIDGKPASFSKRGYLIEPGETLEVKGWRTSERSVARFEFSSVGASYANRRHGDARNVGVLGIAVFGEKGVDPWEWMPREVGTRTGASAFAEAP